MPRNTELAEVPGAKGLTLVVQYWGKEADPAVVFLHGGGQNRHSWRRTAESVAAQGWRAVAFDLRGHGDTGWSTDGSYAIADYIDDLEAVARTLNGPAVLVGASLGGIVALTASVQLAGLVSALVMVDIGLSVEAAASQRIRSFMLEHAESGFESLESAAAAVAAYLPDRSRVRAPGELANSLSLKEGRWYWRWDPKLLSSEAMSSVEDRSLVAVARQLKLPTLLVRGGRSDVLDERKVEEFLKYVPHAQHRTVAHAGHMIAGDNNDAFNLVVHEFLASIAR